MIRILTALMLASMVGAAAAQTMYRCKDARGKTTFSDHACPGQAAAPIQNRDRLESDCGQGSKSACAELRQAKRRPGAATGAGKADSRKSPRKRSAD